MKRSTKKRKPTSDNNLCIICQESKKDSLEQKRQASLRTLKERAVQRRKARDINNYEAIQRIEEYSADDPESSVYAHKKCYSEFTNVTNIDRIFAKLPETVQSKTSSPSEAVDSEQPSASQRVSRRSVQPTDWSLCIFCQRPSRHQLINIRPYNVNYPIMKNAKYDNKRRVRLAGVSDLMAAERKYHKYCLTKFERTTARNAQNFFFEMLSKTSSNDHKSRNNSMLCDRKLILQSGTNLYVVVC